MHQFFGRVITHQTQPSSIHVLLPCSGRGHAVSAMLLLGVAVE